LNVPQTEYNVTRDSWIQYGRGYALDETFALSMIHAYTCGLDRDQIFNHNPYYSPLYHKNHKGLPPTLLHLAEWDLLRDGGIAYYNKLIENGNTAKLTVFPKAYHGKLLSYLHSHPTLEKRVFDELLKWIWKLCKATKRFRVNVQVDQV